MKKNLTRLGAVFCLSLAVLVCAHLALGWTEDKVEIRETVLAGDRSAAQGLEIACSVYDDSHHLRWDATLTLGGDIAPETEFQFFTGRHYWEIPPEYTAQLYLAPLNFSMSGRVADDQRDAEYEYMVRPAMDAASRTAPGEKRTETLRLADYYDCYPLALEAWTPEGPIYSTSWRGSGRTLDREEWQKVNDYFRLPVPPEATVTVTAERNEAGELVEITCEETEAAEQFAPMSSVGVASGEALYLPVIPSQEAPDQVAAGIHVIPLLEKEDRLTPDLDHIRLLYPLALAAADEVIVPIKLDAFSIDGMAELPRQIASMQKINPGLTLAGVLITMWRNVEVVNQAEKLLRDSRVPVFGTAIRRTDIVDESTFQREPLHLYSPRSAASLDYRHLAEEYLGASERGRGKG